MMWTRWCLPVKFKSYLTLKISFNKRSLTTLKRLKSVFSQYKRSAPACNLSLKIPNYDWRFFVTFFRHNFWLRILHVLPFYCVFADSSRCDQIYMNRPFWFKFRRLGQREMFYFRTFHFPTFSTSKHLLHGLIFLVVNSWKIWLFSCRVLKWWPIFIHVFTVTYSKHSPRHLANLWKEDDAEKTFTVFWYARRCTVYTNKIININFHFFNQKTKTNRVQCHWLAVRQQWQRHRRGGTLKHRAFLSFATY